MSEMFSQGEIDRIIEDSWHEWQEQKPCEDEYIKSQESSSDVISRHSAIILASDLKQDLPDDERIADMVMSYNEGILDYQTQLSLLPSITTKQRTGYWIKTISENGITSAVRCSECGFEDNRYMLFKYCPNCGYAMFESHERSE